MSCERKHGIVTKCNLQNRNVIVDLGTMLLCNALSNPNDVTTFLLLELKVGIEDTEVELLHESVDVQFYLEKRNELKS